MAELEACTAGLQDLRLENDQPNIRAPAPSIGLDASISFNFQDRNAFETEARWIEETQIMEKLEDVLKNGEHFINMVYTYRSISKAIPQVKTSDQANKQQIHEASFEVLEPEVMKLKGFMFFQQDTIRVFCDQVRRIALVLKDKKKSEEFIVSESLIMHFIRMLDLFALLDALKNMKASFNNDLSFYKRALGNLKRTLNDQTQENHNLYLFLANQFSITTKLKEELHHKNLEGFDDVLTIVLNQCADYLEVDRYLLPAEKHCLLRVIPFVIFLMTATTASTACTRRKTSTSVASLASSGRTLSFR